MMHQDNSLLFESKSTLTDSYQMISPTKGGCYASVINAKGREYIFFVNDLRHLCYYLSDDKTDTGYTVVQTDICGVIHYVKAAIAPGGEVLILLSCLKNSTDKTNNLMILRETYAGSGIMERVDTLETGTHPVRAHLLCEAGVVAYTSTEHLRDTTWLGICRRIYMGTDPGVKREPVNDDDLLYAPGPHMVYGRNPNEPNIVFVTAEKTDRQFCIYHFPLDLKQKEVYQLAVPEDIEGDVSVVFSRSLRTSDRRNHLILCLMYTEGEQLLTALVELTSEPDDPYFNQAAFIWKEATENINPVLMDATISTVEDEEHIHILLKGMDKRLYHLSLPDAMYPLAIDTDIDEAHFCVTAEHHATIVCQDCEGVIRKLELDPKGGEWIEEEIAAPDENSITSIRAYTSVITVSDKNKAAYPAEKVQIWSDGYLHVEVNGVFYDIGPHQQIQVSTDGMGMLRITHEASELAQSDIYLRVPRLMGDAEKYTLRCYDEIQSRLKKLQWNELLNAKRKNGQYLLPEQYRTEASAKAISTTVQDLLHDGKSNLFQSGCAAFSLTVEDGQLCYRQLQSGAVDRFMAQMKENETNGFFTKIGDFFRSVAKGIAKVVTSLFEKTGKAIKAAFKYIIDGITYCIDAVIGVIQEVFDTVEVVFSKVMVLFVDLFEWLGDPFDWAGLRRTKKALECVFECGVKLIKNNIQEQHKKIDEGFKQILETLSESIDTICGMLDNRTISRYQNDVQNESGDALRRINNNVVIEKLLVHYKDIEIEDEHLTEKIEETFSMLDFEALVKALSEETEKIWEDKEFSAVLEHLKATVYEKNSFSNCTLQKLLLILKDIMILLLKGIKGIVDLLFDWMERLLDVFVSLLGQRVRIPFLGSLYLAMFKEKPTVGGFCSFIGGAVINPLCNLKQEKGLFANDSELECFINEMKQLTDTTASERNISPGVQKAMGLIACIGQTATYLLVLAFDDMEAWSARGDRTIKKSKSSVKCAIVFLSICCECVGFPAWYGQSDWSCYLAWTAGVVLVVISIIQTVHEGFSSLGLSRDDGYYIVTSLAGSIYMVLSLVADIRTYESTSGWEFANDIFVGFSSALRFFLMKDMIRATEGASFAAIIILDLACAGMGFALVLSGNEDENAGISGRNAESAFIPATV